MKFIEFIRGAKTRWILPAAIAAALAVVLIPMAVGTTTADTTGTETVYKETTVQRGDITVGVTESGTASLNTNSVTCELEGAEIEEMYVKAGQSVTAGDAIAKLTGDSVSDALATYQLALETAEIKLAQAKSSYTTGQVSAQSNYESSLLKKDNAQNTYNETIENLTEAVSTAQANVDNCTGTITYYTNRLANDGAVIYAEYKIDGLKASLDAATAQVSADIAAGYNNPASDHYTSYVSDVATQQKAQDSYDTAVSNYESEKMKETSALATMKSGLTGLRNKVTQAKLNLQTGTVEAENQMTEDFAAGNNAGSVYNATVASLKANVDAAQQDYDKAKESYDTFSPYATDPVVYSEYTGLVYSVGYSAGNTVSLQTAVATITDNTTAYVTVSVTQDDISNIAVGDSANVEFTSFEGTKFTGTVDSITISPARSESSTVSYVVSVVLTGDGVEELYDGMTGNVTFVTKEVSGVLYVSNKAITSDNGVQTAKVKDDQGNITQIEVTTGFSDGTNTEVVSGLTEGQTVIIESQAVTVQ